MILQIETATFNGSVALSINGKTIDQEWLGEGEKHIKTLAPKAKELLLRNDVSSTNLKAIAISEGPGSYTGLRIGVSFAKGICQALDIPLISVPTLSIIAKSVFKKYEEVEKAVPLLDARRMEVYTAVFNTDMSYSKVKPLVLTEESFKKMADLKVVFAGNGTEKAAKLFKKPNWTFDADIKLDASFMTEMVYSKFNSADFEDLMAFQPFYLKEFAVGAPSKKIMNILNS